MFNIPVLRTGEGKFIEKWEAQGLRFRHIPFFEIFPPYYYQEDKIAKNKVAITIIL
jgi:hypothetical protein